MSLSQRSGCCLSCALRGEDQSSSSDDAGFGSFFDFGALSRFFLGERRCCCRCRLYDQGEEEDQSSLTESPLKEELVEAVPLKYREWRRLGGKTLEEPLEKGSIRLLDAKWLVRLAKNGGTLRWRQNLPEEAFSNIEKLKCVGVTKCQIADEGVQEWLPIIVVSYPWLEPTAPDPFGESLQVVAAAVQTYLRDPGAKGRPYGVLIDIAAMPQLPRTEEEDAIFEAALSELDKFYAHPNTIVLKVTKLPEGYPDRLNEEDPRYHLSEDFTVRAYDERGWCYAESAMSGLVKNSSLNLDLGVLQEGAEFDGLGPMIQGCRVPRVAPLDPEAFRAELDGKTFTDREGDFERVAALYQKAFERHLVEATELDFSGLGWDGTAVERIVLALQGSSTLQSLDLHGNEIGPEGMHLLEEALCTNTVLLNLDVSDNKLGDEGALVLANVVWRNTRLVKLNACHNGIGRFGGSALAKALGENYTLRSLDVHGNAQRGIGARAGASFGIALKLNQTLHELNLCNSRLGAEGAKVLGEALLRNHILRTLLLDNNNLGPVGAAAIAKALGKNKSLMCLDLGSNAIWVDGCCSVSAALCDNSKLDTLRLKGNAIGAEGARLLDGLFYRNKIIKSLDIGDNETGVGGARALAATIRAGSTLQTLNLDHNQIGDLGACALAESLKNRGQMIFRELRISSNSVGSKGAGAIAEALLANVSMKVLDMSHNKVGVRGARCLAQGLGANTKLVKFDISHNEIGDEGASALVKVVHRKSALKMLALQGNDAAAQAAAELKKLQKRRPTMTLTW